MKPLQDITVVAIEQAIAAPFATRQLGDLGARVIKIERPEGGDFARDYDQRVGGLSSHFVWCNRNKESVAVDLKSERGLRIAHALIARADVFVQNLAPGAAQRLGLGFESLHRAHPRLIVCDISGYGMDGPYRDRKAYDLLIQAESGFLSVTGTADEPVKAGCSIADIAAGMYAYSNVLAALIERARTGKGKHIDVSLLESMAEWMGFPMYYGYDGAPPPPRAGAAHATIAPYGPFSTADGEVLLAVQNDREWREFCRSVLERPDTSADPRFLTNPLRVTHREALIDLISNAIGHLSTDQTVARLERAGIANARINDVAGLWAHPQLKARERWTSIRTPMGSVPTLLPPGISDARMDAVPGVGEHTQAILAELGIEPEVAPS